MSGEQFLRYLEARFDEVKKEKSRALKRGTDANEDYGSYRMTTRLVCNYAVPPELGFKLSETADDDGNLISQVVTDESGKPTKIDNSEILQRIKSKPDKYLSEAALNIYSPKMLRMFRDVKEATGEPGSFNNMFIYSQYLALQGLGIFSAVLEANGYQRYKVIKENGLWKEDPSMKPNVPAFGFYTGEEGEEERELYRQIFNEQYEDKFPQSLKDSIKEKRLCILMATKAGAEGIDLKNVRNVFIMEPYWNPALLEQAIGRAIRICSHATLPLEKRTVKVKIYMSVFTPEQSTTQEGPNIVAIRRGDMILKRYEGGEPKETFMTSDEFLWETAYEKNRIIKNISHLLKQSAVDCEIHRKLHGKEQPVIQCLRFDTKATGEDLAYKPDYRIDEKDTLYMRNIERKARRLQKIKVKEMLLLLDPDTNEIFDLPAFEDTQRLVRLGMRSSPGEIRFFTSVIS
jgi:hypothetical protein